MYEAWCVHGVGALWWLRHGVYWVKGHCNDWDMMLTVCGGTVVIEAWCVHGVRTLWWSRHDVYMVWGHCEDWGMVSTQCVDTVEIEAWCVHGVGTPMIEAWCVECAIIVMFQAWGVQSVGTLFWLRPCVHKMWGHRGDWGMMRTWCGGTVMIEAWCVLSVGTLMIEAWCILSVGTLMIETWCLLSVGTLWWSRHVYMVWWHCNDWAMVSTECGNTVVIEAWCGGTVMIEAWCLLSVGTLVIEAGVHGMGTLWLLRHHVFMVWGYNDDWGMMSTGCGDTVEIKAWCKHDVGTI